MQRTCVRHAVLALCAAVVPAAQAVNKCTLPDGKLVYQDAPCAAAAKSMERVNISGAGVGDLASQGAQQARYEVAKAARAERVALAIARGEVFIGMSADEVVESWGRPTRVNTSVGAYGRHEQWVYQRGRLRAQYVYLQNWVVTSTQSTE